jgi:hypothetical protein
MAVFPRFQKKKRKREAGSKERGKKERKGGRKQRQI